MGLHNFISSTLNEQTARFNILSMKKIKRMCGEIKLLFNDSTKLLAKTSGTEKNHKQHLKFTQSLRHRQKFCSTFYVCLTLDIRAWQLKNGNDAVDPRSE